MAKTLFIGQTAYLQGMNVFGIGGNKPHINLGLMGSQIASLSEKISSIPTDIKHLAIPGYVLELLEENSEKALDSLKSFVKTKNLSLLSVPYYNSSLSLLSKEELLTQISMQESITKRIFGKSCDGFLCAEGFLPPKTEEVLNGSYSSVIYPKGSSLTLKDPSYRLTETEVTTIGENVSGSLSHADSKMEAHLIAELRDMYPHIVELGDDDSLLSWRFMTQPSMILRAGVDAFANDAYEHYMQMMNTLNDVAHKINVVQLAKKGLFQEKPTISSSPSSIIVQ